MEWMPHPHTTENTSGEAAAEAGVVAVRTTCKRVQAAHAEKTTVNMMARVVLITREEEILTSVLGLNLNLPSMKEEKVVILLVEEVLVGSPRSMKLVAIKTLTRSKGTMT
jgi:hypothetical protein